MALIQVTYDVPDEMWASIVTGTLKRFGSVVRDSRLITNHLKEVDVKVVEEAAAATVKHVAAGARNNAVPILIGIGAIAATAVSTYLITRHFAKSSVQKGLSERQPAEQIEEPAQVAGDYNAALSNYIDAIRRGNITPELVNNLSDALSRVQKDSDSETITLEFSLEQSEMLVKIVAEYTQQLAEANSFELQARESSSSAEASPVVELRHYLDLQKLIIEKAA